MHWSTKPNIQREGCSLSTIYRASPHHQRSRHVQDLTRVSQQKVGGLDHILGHVLRTCAGELADVLTDIFNTHYDTSGKDISCILSEGLPPHLTDINCDEVFWAACQTTHHSQPPCIIWPISVCLLSQPLHRGCNIHHFTLSHHSSGPERHLCQNPVHSTHQHSTPSSPRK